MALDAVPDGQVTTVETAALYGVVHGAQVGGASAGGVVRGAEVAGTSAGGGVLASSVNMARWGFPGGAQGQYTVGIVVRPRANPVDWGHTSLVLRRGGGPVEVVGFNPDMRTARGLIDIARNYSQVEQGTQAVRGRFTGDSSMFTANKSIHIEYPISEAEAAQFAMTKPGLAPNLNYVARPAVYRPAPGACSGANCGLWAIGELESQTGGVVGRVSDPAGITSMGRGTTVVSGRASQPVIVDMARGGLENPASISPLRPGGLPPVVSAMPRVVRVLRVGGKVMLVVGIVAGAHEIVTARPEEQTRTIVGVGGGFAGGFLLGATAGLICGAGAPVCSLVLGLSLGTLGALGGRVFAEGAYDYVTAPVPASTPSASSSGSGPPVQQQWELLFVPPPQAPAALFLTASGQSPLVREATPLDLAFAGQ